MGLINKSKVIKNIGWLSADRFFRLGMGLFINLWLARFLGPEQFGGLNYAMAYVGIFTAIISLGFNDIVVRDLVLGGHERRITLGTSFALQILAGIFSIFLIYISRYWLKPLNPVVDYMIVILSAGLLFKSSDVIRYWYESQLESKRVVWIENLLFFLFLLLKIYLIYINAPVTAFAWAILIESMFVAISLLAMYSRNIENISLWKWKIARAKSLLSDSWPIALSSIAIIIYMRIDQIMLGQMADEKSVGIFSAALRLSEAWYFIPMIITTSVFPAILALKLKDRESYKFKLQLLYDLLSCLSIIVAIITTIFSNHIIAIFYGPEFEGAGEILAIQIWAGVFVSLGVARGKWLVSENLQHLGFWYIGLAMLFNVACNYYLIPIMGAVGAAYSTIVAQSITAFFAPLLFSATRPSVYMMVKSLNPMRWIAILKFLYLNLLKKDF
jgi:O-antigen/teichoic acid export membrane protein